MGVSVDNRDISRDLAYLGGYLARHHWSSGNGSDVTRNVFREITKQLHLKHRLDSVDVRDFLMDKAVSQLQDKLKEIVPEVKWAIKATSWLTDQWKDLFFSKSLANAGPDNNVYTPDGDECPQYVEFMIYGWKHGRFMYKAKGNVGNAVGDNSPSARQMRELER
jgi:hypothetical protein